MFFPLPQSRASDHVFGHAQGHAQGHALRVRRDDEEMEEEEEVAEPEKRGVGALAHALRIKKNTG